jgi:hypothetical protein
MSEMYRRLRAAISDATFHPPATEQQIVRVEQMLGTRFPEWLRELYLCCNGISGHEFQEPYLNVLESPGNEEGCDYSLLGWNKFQRDECDFARESYAEGGRLDEWEKSHARNFLIIGNTGATAQDWAIRLDGGTEIVWYDVRNPGYYEVLGQDLVEVVVNYEREEHVIRDQIFRGREPIRREKDPLPPSTDIELLVDTLNELERGSKKIPMFVREATSPNFSLYRGISQKPSESGMLFILRIGRLEFQIATQDGNLPFVLRTQPSFQPESMQCLVGNLPDALICILYLLDIDRESMRRESMRDFSSPAWDALVANAVHVWRHRGGSAIPELQAMAEILFGRDDRRFQEDTRLGG